MGSAASLLNIPDVLNEKDSRELAGEKFNKADFKKLANSDGLITKKDLLKYLRKVDSYFTFFWRHRTPFANCLSRIRLIKNMVTSYGITVWLSDEPHVLNNDNSVEDRTFEDALSIVVFVTEEFFSSPPAPATSTPTSSNSEGAPPSLFTAIELAPYEDDQDEEVRNMLQRVARMRSEYEQLPFPAHLSKVILVVLEPAMTDRSNWSPTARELFASCDTLIDISGDLDNTSYLSASVSRLCEVVTGKIGEPVKKQVVRSISVRTLFVPTVDVSRKLNARVSSSLMQNIIMSEANPSTVRAEILLPRIYDALDGSRWQQSNGWCGVEAAARSNSSVLGTVTEEGEEERFGLFLKEGQPNRLLLGKNNLAGPLPYELFELRFLRTLNLSCNNISGVIPAEIAKLRLLRVLSLAYNRLEGSIPAQIGALSELLDLSLGDNCLTGEIPLELCLCQQLNVLDLGGNQLYGEIPCELSKIRRLQMLSLHRNQFTGKVPGELAECEELLVLSLHHNQLGGPVPPALGRLSRLEQLLLQSNHLVEAIPGQLTNLRDLNVLNLGDNKLSGVVPRDLSVLTRLTELHLYDNNLMGVVPKDYTALRSLTVLSLYNNKISGAIPPGIGHMTSLQSLQLGLNKLSGKIPLELSLLTNLTVLTLNNNRLAGEIPKELSTLTGLAQLLLNDNTFSSMPIRGAIPPEIGDLTNLEVLYLHNNKLEGTIPYELSQLTKLREFYISGNKLTGMTREDVKFLLPACDKIYI